MLRSPGQRFAGVEIEMLQKLAIALHCDDEDAEALLANLPAEGVLHPVPGLAINLVFTRPKSPEETCIIGRLKVGRDGVSRMDAMIDEMPDDRKTIELRGDQLIVCTHAHDDIRQHHAFCLDAVKMPPGKRLVVVSDEDAP